jgi:hypothetical protein
MNPDELEKLERELRKKFPHSRVMEVREIGEGQYEITMMNFSTDADLLTRIDRHTELK